MAYVHSLAAKHINSCFERVKAMLENCRDKYLRRCLSLFLRFVEACFAVSSQWFSWTLLMKLCFLLENAACAALFLAWIRWTHVVLSFPCLLPFRFFCSSSVLPLSYAFPFGCLGNYMARSISLSRILG